MRLSRDEEKALAALVATSKPISGTFFRSAERRFMDPSKVLSGSGTELYGGRFAPVGTKAVYLADSDAGASQEVLARKARLGGASQISLDKYPRIVFAVDVRLQRAVRLVQPRNASLKAIVVRSLSNDLEYSYAVGRFLADAGVDGLFFKSAVGTTTNLIVFLENCGSTQLEIRQLAELLKTIATIAKSAGP